MGSFKPAKAYYLLLRNREVPLIIKKMRSARSMTIRWRPVQANVLLTLPYYVSVQQGLAFARERREWLAQCVEEHGEPKKLAPGTRLTVLGKAYELRHAPGSRGVVQEEKGTLMVSGEAEFFARRLSDWLKVRAKAEIEIMAREYARRIDRRVKRVSVRDTTTRWGSCAEDGALSFSWRLIFAPREVMDYVVAHEVAHLAEMNHSPDFWRLVERLCPHHETARAWLNQHGQTLYVYS